MPRMANRTAPPNGSPTGIVRAVGPAVLLVATVTVVATVAVASRDAPRSPFVLGIPEWLSSAVLASGASLLAAAWLVAVERPRAAIGLAMANLGLVSPVWAGLDTTPPSIRVVALALWPLAIAGAAQVGLGWSHAARHQGPMRATAALALGASVALVAGYDPLSDPGCSITCLRADPVAGDVLSTRGAYLLAAGLVVAASALAALVLALEIARHRSSPVAWGAFGALIVLPLPWVIHAIGWTDVMTAADALLPGALAGLLLGVSVGLATQSIRRARSGIRELLEELAEPGLPGVLAGQADRVQFAIPGTSQWVDHAGRAVAASDVPASAAVVDDGAGPAVRIALVAGVAPDEVVANLTPAAMLALQNARLSAVALARLDEVRASQRRIVAASDAERRRIERDLHDGAQQRLVGASFYLNVARSRLPHADAVIAQADAHVRDALVGLRRLGHGLFPAALASEGLGAALEDLARDSGVPATVNVGDLDVAGDVAMAGYAIVFEALAHAARAGTRASADVEAARQGDRLELRVLLHGCPVVPLGELEDVADRVGAVGGRLAVEAVDGAVMITATMPCA
jgi:signal transduction histidine kinase